MAKRVVVWGTGFVGKLVIPEILRHPGFELVGVGVSNPAKVGKDVGEICSLDPVGVAVDVAPVGKLPRAVTLSEIKAKPSFNDFALVRISRLSVMPVTDRQWAEIEKMSRS